MAKPKTSAGASIFARCKKEGIEFVDVKFVDLLGTWRHITLTMDAFTEDAFVYGVPFDGSSIPGFQSIVESDMVLMPDPVTAFVDPFCELPTLSIIAEPLDPSGKTLSEYENNPRYIVRSAMQYMKKIGIADTMYVGPEIEFFIFDDVRFGSDGHYSMYRIDSSEGYWNSDAQGECEGNDGFRPGKQGGYFAQMPIDQQQDIRGEMVRAMQRVGMIVERHHHEVAGPGQAEINIRYQPMLKQADQVMLYKYIVRHVAKRHGKSVTFMPKPLFGHNGTGMHCHQSLWKGGKPLFWDEKGYGHLSKLGLYYIGGILKHAPSILAFGAPTTNSYKRLTPGYEAPVVLAYSKRNRSAAVRVPIYHPTPAGTRIEFRSSDALANPYLLFPALLLAGLDGIKNKILPGEPQDKNLFHLSSAEEAKMRFVPSSLEDALQALTDDHRYLNQGGVFSEGFIERYVAMKKTTEADAIRLRPHPHELALYYNA